MPSQQSSGAAAHSDSASAMPPLLSQPLREYGTGRARLVRALLRVEILPPLTASASWGEGMPPAGRGVAIPRAARSTVPGSVAG